ncbi:hypothetical protein A2U01_0021221 [Trifolium medium]|uniref:Uncharacterized protein n=1 Tax=Trifolium medium TaxID=97028 RepID=A0A392NLD8_9FABA|nr:hypothetical protein [Trifolium medium]
MTTPPPSKLLPIVSMIPSFLRYRTTTSRYRKMIPEMDNKPPSLQRMEIPVDNAQLIVPATSADIAAVLAALRQTNEMLQQQGLRQQQGPRLDAVERNQHPRRNNSPPRRHHRSRTPPRQENVSQRRPPLEHPPPPSKKRDRTPLPPTTKKGKTIDRPE